MMFRGDVHREAMAPAGDTFPERTTYFVRSFSFSFSFTAVNNTLLMMLLLVCCLVMIFTCRCLNLIAVVVVGVLSICVLVR